MVKIYPIIKKFQLVRPKSESQSKMVKIDKTGMPPFSLLKTFKAMG